MAKRSVVIPHHIDVGDAVLGRFGWHHLGAIAAGVGAAAGLERLLSTAGHPITLILTVATGAVVLFLSWPTRTGTLAAALMRFCRFVLEPRIRTLVLPGPSSHSKDWLGIVEFSQDAVWFADGSAVAVAEVSPVNLELRADSEREALISGFASLLNGLAEPVQILLRTTPAQASSTASNRQSVEPTSLRNLRDGLARHLDEIVERHQALSRRVYLVVSVTSRRSDETAMAASLTLSLQQLGAGLDRMGLRTRQLSSEDLAQLWHNLLQGGRDEVAWKGFSPVDWPRLIAPTFMEQQPDACRIGETWYRTLVGIAYPRLVSPGWLQRLYNFPGPMAVSLRIDPLPSDRVLERLDRKAAELLSSNRAAANAGRLVERKRELAQHDVDDLRDRVQAGEDRLFRVALCITVQAASREGLDTICSQLQSMLRGLLLETRPLPFRPIDGFRATLPVPRDPLHAAYLLDTRSLATFFPFVGSELPSDAGTFLGLHTQTGVPVFLNRFRYENYNALVLAKSGAGKSYLLKLELLRSLLSGIRVMVLDPQGEYHRLALALGGQILRPEPGLDWKTSVAKSRFTVVDLRPDVNGKRPTSEDQLAELRDALFTDAREPRLLAVDEAWLLMREPAGGTFLCEVAKTARKYWLGFSCATQDIEDFLQHPGAQTLITNSSVQFLLRQAPQAVPELAAAFHLSQPEQEWLMWAAIGEALLMAGSARVPLRVLACPEEHRLITTNPAELGAYPAGVSADARPFKEVVDG